MPSRSREGEHPHGMFHLPYMTGDMGSASASYSAAHNSLGPWWGSWSMGQASWWPLCACPWEQRDSLLKFECLTRHSLAVQPPRSVPEQLQPGYSAITVKSYLPSNSQLQKMGRKDAVRPLILSYFKRFHNFLHLLTNLSSRLHLISWLLRMFWSSWQTSTNSLSSPDLIEHVGGSSLYSAVGWLFNCHFEPPSGCCNSRMSTWTRKRSASLPRRT